MCKVSLRCGNARGWWNGGAQVDNIMRDLSFLGFWRRSRRGRAYPVSGKNLLAKSRFLPVVERLEDRSLPDGNPIALTLAPLNFVEGPNDSTVASFTDATSADPASYSALIAWGDG